MYKFFVKICRIISFFIFRIKINGKENLPPNNQAFIMAANHLSMVDPVVLTFITEREIHFMAKVELFKTKLTKWFFESLNAISVDRRNNDITAIKKSLRVLKEGNILGIFPEGTRAKGKDDVNAKQGVILLAHKAKVDIIPVFINSKFKLFEKVEINILPKFQIQKYVDENGNYDYDYISNKLLEYIYEGGENYKNRNC